METKADLIAKGKELGINLKKSMSIYEMKSRIKEAEEKIETEEKKPKKSEKPARGGEY